MKTSKKDLSKANDINSPREDYVKSYNRINDLIKNNHKDKLEDTPKYSFFVDWQKCE